MYSKTDLAFKFLRYWINASSNKGHGIHSPFVFQFIKNILGDRNEYDDYRSVEELRKELLKDERVLTISDPGAGSATSSSNKRAVSSIAKHAAKPAKYGQLLYRMAKFYRPSNILEMGTSLGISTAYLAKGNNKARVTTIEGVPAIADIAKANLDSLGIMNYELVRGNFDEVLEPLLNKTGVVDLAFIDGNHRKEPTEKYFHLLLQHINEESILIFDDIHWSQEMEATWNTIKNHPRVRCSIDLFFLGIVFFRKEFHEKQQFSIRF
jgi:predicted O-methyltransferase YrrM